jgi:hypothetical protein
LEKPDLVSRAGEKIFQPPRAVAAGRASPSPPLAGVFSPGAEILHMSLRLLAQFLRQRPQVFSSPAAEQSREFVGIKRRLRKDGQFGRLPVPPEQPEETLQHLHGLEPRMESLCE